MNHNLLISYAEGLIEYCEDTNKLEIIRNDLLKLRDILDENEQLKQLLDNPFIKYSERIEIMHNLFDNQIDSVLIKFLSILVRKNYVKYVHKLYREFKHLYNKKNDILEGFLYTPFDLEKEQIFRICKDFEARHGSKIDVKVIRDESLIGGFRIIVSDTIYDYTLKNKLENVKNNLLYKLD